jgi:hypothetical protein
LLNNPRIIELEPGNEQAYTFIGALLVRMMNLRQAVAYFERAIQLGDQNAAELLSRVKLIVQILDKG